MYVEPAGRDRGLLGCQRQARGDVDFGGAGGQVAQRLHRQPVR